MKNRRINENRPGDSSSSSDHSDKRFVEHTGFAWNKSSDGQCTVSYAREVSLFAQNAIPSHRCRPVAYLEAPCASPPPLAGPLLPPVTRCIFGRKML